MSENKYDNEAFFAKYAQMSRSVYGLKGAGEWESLQKLLPDFKDKRVLDLGCGYGWHCQYALEQGASTVVGVDISHKMLEEARKKIASEKFIPMEKPIEEIDFAEASFDIVFSSLAFHYIKSFGDICRKVRSFLVEGGMFIFSIEHPIFTAQGPQQWIYDESGNISHWPVDDYFIEGERTADFLEEKVKKYHRTTTSYINDLLQNGFRITGLCEPQPTTEMLKKIESMKDELRRPMMMIIAAEKE